MFIESHQRADKRTAIRYEGLFHFNTSLLEPHACGSSRNSTSFQSLLPTMDSDRLRVAIPCLDPSKDAIDLERIRFKELTEIGEVLEPNDSPMRNHRMIVLSSYIPLLESGMHHDDESPWPSETLLYYSTKRIQSRKVLSSLTWLFHLFRGSAFRLLASLRKCCL